jgi:hypothetical protein
VPSFTLVPAATPHLPRNNRQSTGGNSVRAIAPFKAGSARAAPTEKTLGIDGLPETVPLTPLHPCILASLHP